ncbi:MAG: CotH kinase family protein [Bacteroidia bacterium]|nr:CotH kinase family protein [Bacteroidia bacterium]
MEIAVVVLLWLFICLQMLVLAGFFLQDNRKRRAIEFPKLAILVPARNEEDNIAACIESLLQLNYPKEQLEIWIGNDQSTDNTEAIIANYAKLHKHIHLYNVPSNLGSAKAKGNVLAHLVKLSSAPYILVTDADIEVGKNWANELLTELVQPGVGIVSGTTLVRGKNLAEEAQSLDWTLGNGYLIGLNQLGLKSTAVGNNMGFTREAYLATGGYENMPFSVTEDFQLFTAIRAAGFKTVNLMNEASLNHSKAQSQLSKLLHQRKRWMMGAQALPWYWAIIFGVQAFFYVGIFMLLWLNLNLAIRIWVIKWVFQQGYLILIHKRVKEPLPVKAFLLYELYSIFMHIAMITFYLLPAKMDWKGRKYVWLMLLVPFTITSCTKKKIPTIYITKESEISWTNKESCVVSYVQEDSVVLEAEIKCRGGFSSGYPKASYSLELKEKFALGDLPTDDDWILNASYIDKTFMRHKLSYDLFCQMSENNKSAQSTFVHLKVNNDYAGLYLLQEEIDASTLGMQKKDSLAMIFKDPPIFYSQRIVQVEDTLNYYQQKFPKISKRNQSEYIKSFHDFLFFSSSQDFIKNISSWVDLSNIIDWHLILLLSNNSDGVLKNFYWYKVGSASKFRVAIWDYDHSFGRDGDNTLNMLADTVDCERSVLFKRLMKTPGSTYPQALKNRYKELRKSGIFSVKNLNKHIQQMQDHLGSAWETNALRWPITAKAYKDANNYQQEMEVLRKFIDLQLNNLDAKFSYTY